jgi:hypothetical protein
MQLDCHPYAQCPPHSPLPLVAAASPV